MKIIKALLVLLLLFSLKVVHGQKVLTLKECVATGLKSSANYQLKQLEVLSAEVIHRSPALEYLPTVNFTGNHTYNIGSVIDPSTNNRVSSKILSDNFSINAGITLLDLNTFTTARRNKIAVLKATADKEAIAAEYTQSVIDQYITALYSQELLKIQVNQFNNATFNLDWVTKEVTTGKRPKSDLYDMQTSYSQEENTMLQTRQQLYNQKLALLHLMNQSGLNPDDFVLAAEVYTAPVEPLTVDQMYAKALTNAPALKAAGYSESVAKKEISMQRNLALPTLSAYYSYSSFYYQPLNQPGNPSVNPFWKQLNDNKNHYVGLQLAVPLFNGLKTSNKVQQAKVNLEKTRVAYEQEKLKLRQAIEQEDARRLQGVELADKMEVTRGFAEKSFTTTQSKFSSGIVDAITFTASKNQLLMAEYNLLKARITAAHANIKLLYLQLYQL